jgi:hypothetical protein
MKPGGDQIPARPKKLTSFALFDRPSGGPLMRPLRDPMTLGIDLISPLA